MPATRPTVSPTDAPTVQTTAEQAALYRLSGDLNPLHIDPDFARRPASRVRCCMGCARSGRSGTRWAVTPGDRRLAELSARFRAPVFPGDRLDIEIWMVDDAGAVAAVSVAGTVVLGPARASFA